MTSGQNPTPGQGEFANWLTADVEIRGSIKFRGQMFIDGKIDGRIDSEGALTLGENGSVQGEISAGSVSIFGRVLGNVTVTDRCDLKTHAELIGDLKAPRMTIEEGATFVGDSEVRPSASGKPKLEVVRQDEPIARQQAR